MTMSASFGTSAAAFFSRAIPSGFDPGPASMACGMRLLRYNTENAVHKTTGGLAECRFGFLDGVEQAEELSLTGGRREVVLHVLIENDQAGGVALPVGHVAERGGDEAGVIELGDAGGPEPHGSGGVEQDEELGIGLSTIAFEVAAVGAGEDVPIDVA